MKHFFILLLSIFAISVSFGQEITNSNGDTIGAYDASHSVIRSNDSSVLLKFESDGDIFDMNNDLVAHFNNSTGEFTDLNNDVIGIISSSGEIENAAGSVLGSISATGVLTDTGSSTIANANGIDNYKIVYLFCFSSIFK
ncbi:MAG: 5-fold beta-flower protein [Bacteroidota bacterium]